MPSGPGGNNRVSILSASLKPFVRLNLAFLLILLVSRIFQWFLLGQSHTLPADVAWLELRGLTHDVALWFAVSLLLFLPYLAFSFAGQKTATLFLIVVFLLAAMTEWLLFLYFLTALVPLDQVVFSYSVREMAVIARNSYHVRVLTFAPVLLIMGLTILTSWLLRKMPVSRFLLALFFITGVTATGLLRWLAPDAGQFRNPFGYYLSVNKTAYLAEKWRLYYQSATRDATDAEIKSAALRYQRDHPAMNYPGTGYPFLHVEKTPDVLGPFFNLGEKKPNLVVVIVESLSVCFMDNHPIFGSFTPFLDSLSQKSLFWNNFLSTSDRTFNVLPAMFGSLPPGDPTFVREAPGIPFHLSLIRYLRENGYFAGFYYTGDPSFNYMEDFLKRQGTDFLLTVADPDRRLPDRNAERPYWGAPDHVLYESALRAIDSIGKSPRIDIYLTLSLHAPFIPPDRDRYLSLVNDRLKEIDPESLAGRDIRNYKDIFATVLYTDNALRVFFDRCKLRSDYGNTIFIITGDHGLPELNLFRFPMLARYNVPLIIYSPMLKRSFRMNSVSSHYDFTPTMLALLRDKYNLKTRGLAAWMGTGIDTAAAYRNLHDLPFILNNKEIVEYLDGTWLLNRGRIYKVKSGLWLEDSVNRQAQMRLIRKLEDFKTLNTYVTRNNKLVPPEIFFGKAIDSAAVPVSDPARFSPIDPFTEYRPLFGRATLDPRFTCIRIEVDIDVKTGPGDPRQDPMVVLELTGQGKEKLLWHSFGLPCHNPATEQTWHTLRVTEYVDLSYLMRPEPSGIMLYLWNKIPNQVQFDNCQVRITGYH